MANIESIELIDDENLNNYPTPHRLHYPLVVKVS